MDRKNKKEKIRARGGPLGNTKNLKHGAYSERITPEEEQERARFENALIDDLAGDVSTAQRALIKRAGFLEIRLRRCEKADAKGFHIPDEHILAWINSQRLLLTALGLKRTKRSGVDLRDYINQKSASDNVSRCTN